MLTNNIRNTKQMPGYARDASVNCGVDEVRSSVETESGQSYGSDSPAPTKDQQTTQHQSRQSKERSVTESFTQLAKMPKK